MRAGRRALKLCQHGCSADLRSLGTHSSPSRSLPRPLENRLRRHVLRGRSPTGFPILAGLGFADTLFFYASNCPRHSTLSLSFPTTRPCIKVRWFQVAPLVLNSSILLVVLMEHISLRVGNGVTIPNRNR